MKTLLDKATTLLDTVEPDAGAYLEFGQYKLVGMAYWNDDDIIQLYSRPKVESLLTECRKQTLLWAAEEGNFDEYHCDELRRMAEGEK